MLARPPVRRRVLPHSAVHRLTQQIGVAGVAAVFLDQIAHQPAQVRMLTGVVAHRDQLVQAAPLQRGGEPRPGPLDRVAVEGVELLGRVGGRRGELPVVGAVEQ